MLDSGGVVDLGCDFVSILGGVKVRYIDVNIFKYLYYRNCMCCAHCNDECCSYGVDIDLENIERLLEYREQLSLFSGVPVSEWFVGDVVYDEEFAGGGYRRTGVVNGRCVFVSRDGRGCSIHAFCVALGIDFHYLKPVVSCLFPLTFDGMLLHPSDEVEDAELVCLDPCGSLYEGVRGDLRFYFGDDFIDVLDKLQVKMRGM